MVSRGGDFLMLTPGMFAITPPLISIDDRYNRFTFMYGIPAHAGMKVKNRVRRRDRPLCLS